MPLQFNASHKLAPTYSVYPRPTQRAAQRGGAPLWAIFTTIAVLVFSLTLGMIGNVSTLAATNTIQRPTAPAAHTTNAGVADWTVLVYMASDNDLETAALANLREIAQVGSSANLNIVAQVDRIASPELWDDTTAGDWTTTKRFFVQPGMEPEAASAVQDLGEQNTGDPLTLADFITWGVTTYPAQHYALVLWSHGAGWQGFATDDSSGGDVLTLPELRMALAIARARAKFDTFDLIGFDACLMSQLDVLEMIAPYANVAVASAEFEPTQGWAWADWLRALVAQPDQDGATLAATIVKSYLNAYQGSDIEDVTLTAFDLTKVGPIVVQLGRLSDALLGSLSTSQVALARARALADTYAASRSTEFSAVDLGHFAQLLRTHGATGEVATAAEALGSAIQQARIASGIGPRHPNASGLSIYFPLTATLYATTYTSESPLPALTHWDKLLTAFYHAA